jgi:hypothetical protein
MADNDSRVERWKRNGPILGRVIARAWADDEFKQQLTADPNGVLSAEGVEIPNGVNVKVLEETDSQYYLVLPTRPADVEVSDLQGAAAEDCFSCWCF